MVNKMADELTGNHNRNLAGYTLVDSDLLALKS